MKLPSFQGENVPLSDSFCLFFITKGIRCHQSIQPVRPTSNHQPSGESAKPPHPKPPSPREVPRRGGGSQSAKHSRNTPSVSLTRASSLKEGASDYAPTQSLPRRGRCPEGAEGVAAEHASNHRPSGESAKALSALRGRHGVAKGAPLGRTPQTFPPVTAERSKAERAP